MTKQTQTKTAAQGQNVRKPHRFAVGEKVRDIYTGEINTVKCSYWQNYAGGNTADYTVEFEPTEAQPTGWNKSTNLESAGEARQPVESTRIEGVYTNAEVMRNKIAYAEKLESENKTATACQKTPDIEDGATLGELLAKHRPQAQQWHGAYDSEGKLRATFDSESEAYHYVRNRGHMDGGSDKPITTDTAMTLIAEYDELNEHSTALAEALRLLVAECDDPFFKGQPSASAKAQADAALANWEKANK